MTRRLGRRKVGHLTRPGYRAGNSAAGNEHAKRTGATWVDNDWQKTKDNVDINSHWPQPRHEGFLPKDDHRTWADLTWDEVKELETPDGYRVRTMEQAFEDAKAHGQRVEAEAKFQCTVEDCLRLALLARKVFGRGWRAFVWVKTLTTLTGGYAAAVMRLHAASFAGFVTLLLVRLRARFRRRFSPYIDYVRGSHVPNRLIRNPKEKR
ncbi:hypothetical protein [Nocardioides jejuensis]|uniref:Uncharacterized protein n=1 Tax=Nocardioides jejuensis TaxID=2502782 RepID=A0A4R1BY60_9ACTN|nr:hypothetical protein [Nocardioides jejuensis]TCJ23014.1 hypothetical protein EPD65_11675 [Nocardioides jejuensis]